jgi:hypothetical protein
VGPTDAVESAFPRPWRVEVNPYGPSADGVDNIFVVCADGYTVFVVAKHPVWNHMELARVALANLVVETMNGSPKP